MQLLMVYFLKRLLSAATAVLHVYYTGQANAVISRMRYGRSAKTQSRGENTNKWFCPADQPENVSAKNIHVLSDKTSPPQAVNS